MILEINLDQAVENFKIISKNSYGSFVVVKANSYGFGALRISESLKDIGCETFCISDISEGVELRNHLGSEVKLICFNGFLKKHYNLYKEKNIIPLVISLEQLNEIEPYNLPFWLMIDTGINRTGILFEEAKKLDLKKYNILGIMSHFSHTKFGNFDQKQLDNIEELNEIYKDYPKSFTKSSALPNKHKYKEFLRCGHALYFKIDENYETKDIAKLYSEVISVQMIKKGEKIGYDGSYVATEDTKVAIVNCGYSFGLDANHPYFLYENIKCPVIGKISMDLSAIDVTAIQNIKAEDKIFVFNENWLDISNHLKCSLGYLSTKLNHNRIFTNYK